METITVPVKYLEDLIARAHKDDHISPVEIAPLAKITGDVVDIDTHRALGAVSLTNIKYVMPKDGHLNIGGAMSESHHATDYGRVEISINGLGLEGLKTPTLLITSRRGTTFRYMTDRLKKGDYVKLTSNNCQFEFVELVVDA